MLKKNMILPPTDEKVVMVFQFDENSDFFEIGLNNFDEITFEIGDETYSTVATPSQLFLKNKDTLLLAISDTTNLPDGSYIPTIKGYNLDNDDGVVLSANFKPILEGVVVVARQQEMI